MNITVKKLQIRTKKSVELINITPEINEIIYNLKVKNGFVLIYTKHTTTALIINENEDRLLSDIKETLLRIVPKGAGYKHDQIDNNAHSHIIASLIGNSLCIPIINGSMDLGTWQSILFIELDGPRTRTITVQTYSE